ncbi:hypothetical protein J4E81_010838 [Alternaria sp. BMP 2799]|nr:hypothetical protein J4E81_010838 [Alternaria sp. BMP 2799]
MQPIADHHNALLSELVAQTNGNLPLAQPEHDAGPQYPAQDPWYTNAFTAAAFDVYRWGGFNADAAFYNTSLNFQHGGMNLEPAFPMAPMERVRDFDNIQAFDQSNMFITPGAQLNPAPYPALVSAPPAPVPAPAPAAVDRIHCPRGCPATFGRGGEYRRHMMIHAPARYRCPMVDCSRTFSRADKLRDHAKKGHGGRNPLNL